MKSLIQITTALALLIHTMGYSQTSDTESISEKQITTSEVASDSLQSFIGTFFLVEADFELKIVQEENKFYIISPFAKDILVPKNESTLFEPTRGIDLELIEGDKDALKYTQNGYETTIKRVISKTEN